MQTKENIRKGLREAYESLSREEQALVQLCSLVYEPVTATTLYKIFKKAGLSFPGEKINSAKGLNLHLVRLKGLKLLNENHQVPQEIIEVITRQALGAGLIFTSDDLLNGIESDKTWTKVQTINHCISCAKVVLGMAFVTTKGALCPFCAESELKTASDRDALEDWPIERIREALSPEGDIRSRLTAIWKLADLPMVFSWKRNKDAETILSLLVQNLGFSSVHPLTSAVQQEALRVCYRMGHTMFPFLLAMIRKDPWQFYANVLTALWLIGPEKPEVQTILKEASDDSNPEIRRCVITILGQNSPDWTNVIIEKLSKDKDSTIQFMARNALLAMKSRRGRTMSFHYNTYQIPDFPTRATLRFGPLVKAVHEELPLERGRYYSFSDMSPSRIIRDLRIAIYSRDTKLFQKRLGQLSSHRVLTSDYSHAIAQIINNPFDVSWFATLPLEIRMYALSEIFHNAMVHLESDADALAYVMKDPLWKSAPQAARLPLLSHLTARLIMGGRLSEAQKIIPEIEGGDYTGGFSGWLRVVEGKYTEAIKLFEADLKELRRRVGKRNLNFSGFIGLFYILALIKSQDKEHLKKADQLVSWSLSSKEDPHRIASAFRSLRGLILAQMLEVENARQIIAAESKTGNIIPVIVNAIASFWVNGQLSKETIDRLDVIFMVARESGLDWVAMESAALLGRTDKETSASRQFVDQVMKQSGMQPLVSSILFEEPWAKCLRALIQIGNEPGEPVFQKSASGTRLIWLVGYYSGEVSLQPIEQKLSPKGEWSKGRPVAMSRLFMRTKLEFMTAQDHAICAAIEHERSYYDDNYFFDLNKLLPALVGHPLLFLESSPAVSVEFVRGDPEIAVVKSGSKLNIRFTTKPGENRVMVIQETFTRFKVVELTEKHRRMAQILGPEGLIVPASATQEVLNAVASLSSHMIIHSDIGGKSKDAEEVEADPTPHVHLIPAGSGYRVEVFVKPFKAEGGPYLKPAAGAANVLAEVGGKRMQTRRDLKTEESMAAALESASPTLSSLADSDNPWLLEDPEDCLQVLLDLKALQEQNQIVVEWPEGGKLKVTREIPIDQFRMSIRGKTDWFEVSGLLQVDDNLVLDMKRLLELVGTTNTRFIPLEEGLFLALTKEFRKRLEELDAYAEKKGKEIRLHPLAALAVQDFIKAIPNLEVDETWKRRVEGIQAALEATTPVPSTLQAELRDYQLEGYAWMARLAHLGIGACLADDMGLGKTVQTLAMMVHRAAQGPSLVVAPTSVCWNWVSEANRFAPTLSVVQFDAKNREELVKGLKHHDVLVTSYGLLIQEEKLLSSVGWNTIVLDEAQAIKNILTRRSQAAMGLKGEFRIITTGTPIENHLGELWTLFNFINPGLLGSLQRFNERYAVPIERYNNKEARRRLRRLIQPFILRRLKSQVLEELPPRTEVVLQVEMSTEEEAFYEALRQQALARIEADDTPITQKHLKILAEIMKLRQAACHPRLVISETDLASSKLELFGDVISELLENRHKALVFSQFVGHLSLIREYLDNRKIGYRYLDGSTPARERRKEVDAFQSGAGDLFLISLKAGGLGLNLTAADYVIHMDPWWNPAVEDQASDRAHRIGQQRPVTIYRLVTKGTIEEKIVKLHQEKRDLAGSLLDGSDISGKISAEELIRLIREE